MYTWARDYNKRKNLFYFFSEDLPFGRGNYLFVNLKSLKNCFHRSFKASNEILKQGRNRGHGVLNSPKRASFTVISGEY